jgi:hypothetical protein
MTVNHEIQLPPLEFDAPDDDFDAFFLASAAVQETFVQAYTR